MDMGLTTAELQQNLSTPEYMFQTTRRELPFKAVKLQNKKLLKQALLRDACQ